MQLMSNLGLFSNQALSYELQEKISQIHNKRPWACNNEAQLTLFHSFHEVLLCSTLCCTHYLRMKAQATATAPVLPQKAPFWLLNPPNRSESPKYVSFSA